MTNTTFSDLLVILFALVDDWYKTNESILEG